MHKIVVFFLMALTMVGCRQAQKEDWLRQVPPAFWGDCVIKNTGTQPAAVFPRYTLLAEALRSEEALMDYLLRDLPLLDSEANKLRLLQRVGYLQKSVFFLNQLMPFSSGDSGLFAMKHSAIGQWLGFYHKQCNDYTENTIMLLLATGRFTAADFRVVALNQHTIGEMRYNNHWVAFDASPAMPMFMQYSAKEKRYLSATELSLRPERITEVYTYGPDSISLFAPMDMAIYRSKFSSCEVRHFFAPKVAPHRVSGEWVLCAGCAIKFATDTLLVLDTLNTEGKALYDSIMHNVKHWLATKETAHMMANSALFQRHFNLSLGVADSIYRGGLFYITNAKHGADFIMRVPTLKVYVPAGADTVFLGEDLRLPFLVTGVEASGPVRIGSMSVERSTFNIWGFTTAPVVSPDWVNYLDVGFVPPHTEATFTVAYNPRLLDFFNGFKLQGINQPDSLQITVTPRALPPGPRPATAP
jgi:hypothetical protein